MVTQNISDPAREYAGSETKRLSFTVCFGRMTLLILSSHLLSLLIFSEKNLSEKLFCSFFVCSYKDSYRSHYLRFGTDYIEEIFQIGRSLSLEKKFVVFRIYWIILISFLTRIYIKSQTFSDEQDGSELFLIAIQIFTQYLKLEV